MKIRKFKRRIKRAKAYRIVWGPNIVWSMGRECVQFSQLSDPRVW